MALNGASPAIQRLRLLLIALAAAPAALQPTLEPTVPGASCIAPTNVTHADPRGECAEGTLIPHGGFCTARCTARFYPSVDRIFCNNGKLDFDTFVCVGLPCPQPLGVGYIEFAHPTGRTCVEGWNVAHGTKCTTMCKPGYHPTPKVLDCQYGVLTPATFSCSGPCVPPEKVPNGRYKNGKALTCSEGPEIIHGYPCTTLCADGYVSKPAQLNCAYGNLTPPTFECVGASCIEPGDIPNAAPFQCSEGLNIPHEGKCTSQCAIGYAPSVRVLSCAFGKLSPPRFECLGTPCRAPEGIERAANFSACEEGLTVQSGSVCTAACSEGYVPTVAELRCDRGLLRPEVFRCVTPFAHDLEARQLLGAAMVLDKEQVRLTLGSDGDAAVLTTAKRGTGGSTALHVSALQGDASIMATVLEARGDPNAADARGWTPLHLAASRGHAATIELLIARGASALARNAAGQTPRDVAAAVAARAASLPELANVQQDLLGGRVFRLLAAAERSEANEACIATGEHCPAEPPLSVAADNATVPDAKLVLLGAFTSNDSNGSNATTSFPTTTTAMASDDSEANGVNMVNVSLNISQEVDLGLPVIQP